MLRSLYLRHHGRRPLAHGFLENLLQAPGRNSKPEPPLEDISIIREAEIFIDFLIQVAATMEAPRVPYKLSIRRKKVGPKKRKEKSKGDRVTVKTLPE